MTRINELKQEIFSHDPERIQVGTLWLDDRAELRVGGATWAFVKEYRAACRAATKRALLNAISIPVIIVSALDDQIADPVLQEKICRELPSGQYFPIEGARHALFIESDEFRERMMKEIQRFVDAQIGR